MKNCYTLLIVIMALNEAWAQPAFTRITDTNNPLVYFTNPAAPYRGAVWIDLNHDNLPDAFMSPRFLFRNEGNGQFSQMTNPAGATGGQGASGSSWADLNNDGFPDFINASAASSVHLGDSSGFNFTAITANLAGLTNYKAWDCAMADVDNNGLIDLLFVHAQGFHTGTPQPCKFYLQTTLGNFTPVTGYEFTDNLAPYTIPTWTDYDLDGDLDLFIGSGPGNGTGPDFCYKNLLKESNNFSLQRLTAAPFNQLQDGQVYNFTDYDNDGDMDGLLTNYIGAPTHFWKNNNGTLVEQSFPFTGSLTTPFLTNVWGDMDNDGDQDVLISEDGSKDLRLYRNNGNGGFDPLETAGSADTSICGVSLADYDNDGDLDILTNGLLGGRALFRNDLQAEGRHWIAFSLTGTVSNRSGIGARLRVKAMIGGKSVWQMREVLAHNSFQSQNDLRQHFGLDASGSIDSLEIYWPSGLIQRFAAQQADHFYHITEGENPVLIVGTQVIPAQNQFNIWPNPGNNTFQIDASLAKSVIRQVLVFRIDGTLIIGLDQIDCSQYTLNIPPDTPAGLYSVQIVFEHGANVTRLLMKH